MFTKTLAVTLFASTVMLAQSAPDMKTLGGGSHALNAMVKSNLLKTANKIPEDLYSFRPVDSVRSVGEMLGHVADAQYFFCNAATGDNSVKSPGVEKNVKAKADIIKALETAFAHCDKAYAATTNENAAEPRKLMGDRTRLGILEFNNMHLMEHYGNLVTYMRIKGIVPPSSERN